MKISPAHFVALASALFLSSCALTGASKPTGFLKPSPDRANPETYGYLYYLDGAGGGTTKKNWVTGVREGLIEAGYLGAGEMFYWGTGKGLKADHKLGVNYKREKAHQLAERIEKHVAKHPDEPVGMLGFSAGGFLPLLGAIVASRFGVASFGSVMGLLGPFLAASAFGPMIFSTLFQLHGNYNLALWVALAALIPGAVAMVFLPKR